jgi:hypothetical protein
MDVSRMASFSALGPWDGSQNHPNASPKRGRLFLPTARLPGLPKTLRNENRMSNGIRNDFSLKFQ